MPGPKLRNAQTNNPHRLAGVDGRTSYARRFADILTALAVEYVGLDPVALRELAGLKLTLELTQAAVIEGDRKARVDLVRISNLIARRERELREAKVALPASTSSLQDRLAAQYAPAIKGGAS
jgi:hypothetical protein